ncbi:hypothetical protein [Puniceibacterium sp. IMCC21224]|uniref:hypothetical protein n=1 Tax=Puniceibacterium sp. IMCC21224 TaxID=1618204 RepID=UPI00064D93A7|nr:hypothetical protein [Puniceibacterium sp. IMCC21224]KMK68591.1 hypothetical protein IMCC21224_113474 [Puniceibacterium sp. IMCC21224]
MSSILKLSGPAGPGLALSANTESALKIAAVDAMVAGGVKGFVCPTFGNADRFYSRTAYAADIQDELFPHIFYEFPVAAGAPTATATGTAPALAWDGLDVPNGARSNQAAQVNGYDGAQHVDLWMIACVTPGDQAAASSYLSVLATSGYGTSIIRATSSNAIQFTVDSAHTLPIYTETDLANPHVYSMRYERATDYVRTYRDGVQQINQYLTGTHPDAEMLTGPIGIGGVGASGTGAPFANVDGRFHVGIVGNGILTNTQHTAIVDWLKDTFSI